ncbi:hypothetical protein [Marinitenerispora sediminis]|uniref:Uncharacterized protein n=1 Tax=Marinitenerispora sediminis TaxID=1931232 RepID=A0A368T6K1_9ACTN|nr:hypothetical protein [Marinitenerispora sediminis]RCV51192.1 hypothetical protein DEF23_20935 [Marinitenerispora sediminis]RCV59327.1 hypothetical protein DEF24_10165 [Marinitenerispora sediminis]
MTLAAKIAAQRMRRVHHAAVAAHAAARLARTPAGWTWNGAPMAATTPVQVVLELREQHGVTNSAALHAVGHAQQHYATRRGRRTP